MKSVLSSFLAAGVAPWISDSFPIIRMVLMILMVLTSLGIIIVVLFQPSESNGLGAISGGSDTFYGKNKSRTLEGTMRRLTVIFSSAIVVMAILFFCSLIVYSGS